MSSCIGEEVEREYTMQQPHNQPPPHANDTSMIIYRIEAVEGQLQQLRIMLQGYVPARENELRLQSIQDTLHRVEIEVGEVKNDLKIMSTELNKNRELQDKLQISVLRWAVGVIISMLLLLLGAYFAHVFH